MESDSSPFNCSTKYSLADFKTEALVLVVVNISTSLLGILGNFLVCLAVFTTQGLTSSFHYFISSLALADLAIALVDQPLFVALLISRIESKCLPRVDFAFRLVGNFACAVALLTLALIAMDRCLFVANNFNYKNASMTCGKKIVLVIVWVLACVYSALRLTVDKEITSYLTTAVFGFCYVEMIVCYVVVYYQVFKQRKILADSRHRNTRNNTTENLQDQTENNSTERRFARTIVTVLVVFTAAWSYFFYLRSTQPEVDYGILYNTARTVALSASAINPLLYCFNNREYRRAFKTILMKCLVCDSQKRRRKQYDRIK